MYMYS